MDPPPIEDIISGASQPLVGTPQQAPTPPPDASPPAPISNTEPIVVTPKEGPAFQDPGTGATYETTQFTATNQEGRTTGSSIRQGATTDEIAANLASAQSQVDQFSKSGSVQGDIGAIRGHVAILQAALDSAKSTGGVLGGPTLPLVTTVGPTPEALGLVVTPPESKPSGDSLTFAQQVAANNARITQAQATDLPIVQKGYQKQATLAETAAGLNKPLLEAKAALDVRLAGEVAQAQAVQQARADQAAALAVRLQNLKDDAQRVQNEKDPIRQNALRLNYNGAVDAYNSEVGKFTADTSVAAANKVIQSYIDDANTYESQRQATLQSLASLQPSKADLQRFTDSVSNIIQLNLESQRLNTLAGQGAQAEQAATIGSLGMPAGLAKPLTLEDLVASSAAQPVGRPGTQLLKTGEYVTTDSYNQLSPIQQSHLNDVGVSAYLAEGTQALQNQIIYGTSAGPTEVTIAPAPTALDITPQGPPVPLPDGMEVDAGVFYGLPVKAQSALLTEGASALKVDSPFGAAQLANLQRLGFVPQNYHFAGYDAQGRLLASPDAPPLPTAAELKAQGAQERGAIVPQDPESASAAMLKFSNTRYSLNQDGIPQLYEVTPDNKVTYLGTKAQVTATEDRQALGTVLSFVPVAGTVYNWKSLPTYGKGLSIAFDVLTVAPLLGAAGKAIGGSALATSIPEIGAIGKGIAGTAGAIVTAPAKAAGGLTDIVRIAGGLPARGFVEDPITGQLVRATSAEAQINTLFDAQRADFGVVLTPEQGAKVTTVTADAQASLNKALMLENQSKQTLAVAQAAVDRAQQVGDASATLLNERDAAQNIVSNNQAVTKAAQTDLARLQKIDAQYAYARAELTRQQLADSLSSTRQNYLNEATPSGIDPLVGGTIGGDPAKAAKFQAQIIDLETQLSKATSASNDAAAVYNRSFRTLAELDPQGLKANDPVGIQNAFGVERATTDAIIGQTIAPANLGATAGGQTGLTLDSSAKLGQASKTLQDANDALNQTRILYQQKLDTAQGIPGELLTEAQFNARKADIGSTLDVLLKQQANVDQLQARVNGLRQSNFSALLQQRSQIQEALLKAGNPTSDQFGFRPTPDASTIANLTTQLRQVDAQLADSLASLKSIYTRPIQPGGGGSFINPKNPLGDYPLTPVVSTGGGGAFEPTAVNPKMLATIDFRGGGLTGSPSPIPMAPLTLTPGVAAPQAVILPPMSAALLQAQTEVPVNKALPQVIPTTAPTIRPSVGLTEELPPGYAPPSAALIPIEGESSPITAPGTEGAPIGPAPSVKPEIFPARKIFPVPPPPQPGDIAPSITPSSIPLVIEPEAPPKEAPFDPFNPSTFPAPKPDEPSPGVAPGIPETIPTPEQPDVNPPGEEPYPDLYPPLVEPKPELPAEPLRKPELPVVPNPEPVVAPTREPSRQPAEVPQPETQPERRTQPQPVTSPQTEEQPRSLPEPVSSPSITPDTSTEPQPAPSPGTAPAPTPIPEPLPLVSPQPVPFPTPSPSPQPKPVPEPEKVTDIPPELGRGAGGTPRFADHGGDFNKQKSGEYSWPHVVTWRQGKVGDRPVRYYENLATGQKTRFAEPVQPLAKDIVPKDTFQVVDYAKSMPKVQRVKIGAFIATVTKGGIQFERGPEARRSGIFRGRGL